MKEEIKLNRFKKKVTQVGTSRVIRVPEAKVGDELIVMSQEEINLLFGNKTLVD